MIPVLVVGVGKIRQRSCQWSLDFWKESDVQFSVLFGAYIGLPKYIDLQLNVVYLLSHVVLFSMHLSLTGEGDLAM